MSRHCSRVLIVHEDSRTGGIGESLAAIIQEEAFESLDAPVRVLGALDTPVPYSPPLEERFLPSEAEIEQAALRLVEYDLVQMRPVESPMSYGGTITASADGGERHRRAAGKNGPRVRGVID